MIPIPGLKGKRHIRFCTYVVASYLCFPHCCEDDILRDLRRKGGRGANELVSFFFYFIFVLQNLVIQWSWAHMGECIFFSFSFSWGKDTGIFLGLLFFLHFFLFLFFFILVSLLASSSHPHRHHIPSSLAIHGKSLSGLFFPFSISDSFLLLILFSRFSTLLFIVLY